MTGWGLLNPFLLGGLAALAVPVLVHLAHRQERDGRQFPSLMFLRQVPFQARRRRTLRDPKLFLLRCLALALLVAGFAAPYVERGSGSTPPADLDVVFLLDRSYSMAPVARWTMAREVLGERIAELGVGQRGALIVFDEAARVLHTLTSRASDLQAALRTVETGAKGTRFGAALAAANRLLVEGGALQGRIVLVSDLQSSGLLDLDELPLGEAVELEIVPVSGPVGANAAVMQVQAVDVDGADGTPGTTLAVVIRNTGDAPLDAGELRLDLEGHDTEAVPFDLAIGEERTLKRPVPVARDRPLGLVLRTGPDAVAADNTHHLVLPPRRPLQVALVEPVGVPSRSAVFFREALRLARSPAVTLRRLSPGGIGATGLAGIDVLVWNDLPLPTGGDAQTLAAFVAAGGGLLVVAGDGVESVWPATGRIFLPGQLGSRQSIDGLGLRIDESSLRGALWSELDHQPGGALSQVRVRAYRSLQPDVGDQVAARLENGSALLVARHYDSGRTLVLTTAVRPDWNTLPLEPGFAPMLHAAVGWLANRTAVPAAYTIGSVVDVARIAGGIPDTKGWLRYLGEGGSLVAERPDGGAHRLRPGEALYRVDEVGVHEVHRGDGAGQALRLAVNTERNESLFEPADAAAFEQRVVRRAALDRASSSAAAQQSDSAGPLLLAIAGLLLVLESLLANRLSAGRGRIAQPTGGGM